MENENELDTHQNPESEEFDTTLSDDEKSSLSPLEIAEKKANFYKNLAKIKSKKVEKVTTPEKKSVDLEPRFTELEQRTELRMSGYSIEEIRDIEKYAKGAEISALEASKNSFVQSAIMANRELQKSKDATLEPSSSSVMVGDKSANEILKDTSAPASAKETAYQAKVQAAMKRR